MNIRKYLIPEFIIGDNSLVLAGQYAKNFGAKKILIVTDQNLINAGWANEVLESISIFELPYVVYKNVSPNPKDHEVNTGAEVFKKEKCNLIIAVGGGSVIDCAKGIGIVVSNNKSINDFEGVDKVQFPMPPLLCIPTTAGSAADISQFAIILNTIEKRKIAIISKSVVPDLSLLDAITTATMPIDLTIGSGIDAMVHAIEAYVSNASSDITNINALKAINLISEYLPLAVKEPNNIYYRGKVMLGSLLAGMAFSNASLGLVHAMAHSLGGILDLPHGECNAVLLEHVIDYNFDSCPEKYKDIYLVLHNSTSTEDKLLKQKLIEYVENFKNSFNYEIGNSMFEKKHVDFELLAKNAFKDPCLVTNPKDITVNKIIHIYERIFQ